MLWRRLLRTCFDRLTVYIYSVDIHYRTSSYTEYVPLPLYCPSLRWFTAGFSINTHQLHKSFIDPPTRRTEFTDSTRVTVLRNYHAHRCFSFYHSGFFTSPDLCRNTSFDTRLPDGRADRQLRQNYRVIVVIDRTRIDVDDFENEKLYVVSFINRQTLHHSIGIINEIVWGKYHTDSCSATIIIIRSNVAIPKNAQ